MSFMPLNCAVAGCTHPAIAMWSDGLWRCHPHNQELADAHARAENKRLRRERVEERLFVELVMHAHREVEGETLIEDVLSLCRTQAKHYAEHLEGEE